MVGITMLSTMCSHGSLPQGNAETWWESQCLAQCAHMEACHKKLQKHACCESQCLPFFLCQHSAWSRWASQHWWCLGSHGPWFSLSLVSLVCLVLCWWPAGTVVWANLQVALDPWPLAYCAGGIVPGFLDPNPGPAAWAGAVLGPVLLPIGWAFHQLGQIYPAWWPWLVTP